MILKRWSRERNDREARAVEDRALRRLFSAASMRREQPPAPYFTTRLKAAVASAQRAGGRIRTHPFGAAAWQMLPALAVLVAILAAWSGYETVQVRRARDEAIARMLEPGGAGVDLLFATALGVGVPPEQGGGKQ